MPSCRLRNKDIDRASGTRLGTLWFLPAFAVVLSGIVRVASYDLGPATRWVWTAVAAVCATCFAWACLERSRARRFVRFLHDRKEELVASGIEYDRMRLTARSTLVQYEVRVSLLLVELTLFTAPRVSGRSLAPNLVTLLLGWWAIPWGPIHTVHTVVQNARGGRTCTVQELLAALARPAKPNVPWWRRFLALDSGDNVQIIMNVTLALVFAGLLGLIAFAIVVANLPHPG